MRKSLLSIIICLSTLLLVSCNMTDLYDSFSSFSNENNDQNNAYHIQTIDDLQDTRHFRNGALVHILEGELNHNNQAVGFHYDGLPSKKGNIIAGTESTPDEHGVFEAKIEINGIQKSSNGGASSFFPKDWNAQEVIGAINEAYEARQHITGNTYEGLDSEGIVIRMYLDNQEKIISAFPVY